MGTTEVQRTLVKSPPELWSELSDQGSLGRLLSDFGEVRIVSTVDESAVHWEAEEVAGSALIKQAGWGTKVTLTVTVASPDAAPERPASPLLAAVGAPVASPIPLTAVAQRVSAEPATAAVTGTPPPPPEDSPSAPDTEGGEAPEATAAPTDSAERTSDEGEPTRRGFFARLFGRRSRPREEPVESPERHDTTASPEPAPEPAPAAERTALEALQARYGVRPAATEAAAPEVTPEAAAPAPAALAPTAPTPEPTAAEPEPAPAAAEPFASGDPAPESASEPATPPDLSSELRSAEESPAGDVKAGHTEDQVKEILTGVLDRLGAAHHRPFSRA